MRVPFIILSKKGIKAKRFKAVLDTDNAEKVLQLIYQAHVILPWVRLDFTKNGVYSSYIHIHIHIHTHTVILKL